jgi:hypothetical protein
MRLLQTKLRKANREELARVQRLFELHGVERGLNTCVWQVDSISSMVARVKEFGATGGELEVAPPAEVLKRLKRISKRKRDLVRPRDANGEVKADEERIRRSGRARTTVSLYSPSHADERLKVNRTGHRRCEPL